MAGQAGWNLDPLPDPNPDLSGVPFSVSAWCKKGTNNVALDVGFTDNSTLTNSYECQVGFDGEADIYINDSGRVAATSATLSLGALSGWVHCVVVFASTTDRRVYVNNNKASNTSSRSVPTCEWLYVTPGTTNLMADLGIWTTGLTDADVARLYRGIPARLIQPSSLIAYNPFIYNDTDPVTGRTDGNYFSINSSAHPPVIAPIML